MWDYPLAAFKLAAWIGKILGQEQQILPKRDVEWTAGELNAILENNRVPSHGGKGETSGPKYSKKNTTKF